MLQLLSIQKVLQFQSQNKYDDEYDHIGPDDSDAEHSESSAISECHHEDQDEPPLKQRRLS